MSASTQLRLRLLATMELRQMRHALETLIMGDGVDDEVLDEVLVSAIDAEPPLKLAAGGFIPPSGICIVGKDGSRERVFPLSNAGKIVMPVNLWTDDERDTPKMIEETLCVLEVALSEYIKNRVDLPEGALAAFNYSVNPHVERVARIIQAARRGVQ